MTTRYPLRYFVPRCFDIDTTLMVAVLPNQKSLDFDYFEIKTVCVDIHTSKFSQMNLASGAGNPGWSCLWLWLVCCKAWWLRSNHCILFISIFTTQVNSTFCACWLASLEAISQVLQGWYYSPRSSQRKTKWPKCQYIVINKITLLSASYSACVIYTKTIILFTILLVKVVDIFLHFGEYLLIISLIKLLHCGWQRAGQFINNQHMYIEFFS